MRDREGYIPQEAAETQSKEASEPLNRGDILEAVRDAAAWSPQKTTALLLSLRGDSFTQIGARLNVSSTRAHQYATEAAEKLSNALDPNPQQTTDDPDTFVRANERRKEQIHATLVAIMQESDDSVLEHLLTPSREASPKEQRHQAQSKQARARRKETREGGVPVGWMTYNEWKRAADGGRLGESFPTPKAVLPKTPQSRKALEAAIPLEVVSGGSGKFKRDGERPTLFYSPEYMVAFIEALNRHRNAIEEQRSVGHQKSRETLQRKLDEKERRRNARARKKAESSE